ncbi:MAG: Sec-independent protein translocase protein TatA [Thermoleophilia bacterium]|nr:Sec-independent protein translocase protein TatA [Thermoleophilia bacterium]
MGIHWQELIVILLIVLVLFGPKRLPEIGSSLGRSIHGFRNSLNGLDASKADQPSTVVAASEVAPAAVPAPVEVVATHDAPANPTAH